MHARFLFPGKCLFVRALAVAVAAALGGCVSPPAEPREMRELREQRRAEASIPLAEREALIERRLFTDFQEESLGLVVTDLRVRAAHMEKGFLNLDQNAHLLAGLAFQFATTGDPAAEKRVRGLIAGIDELDAGNGRLDGHPPLEARVANGRIVVTNDAFGANSYLQLMQAQLVAWRLFSDPALKEAIRVQALRMLEHLRAHDFVVVDARGRRLSYSDAAPRRSFLFGTGHELETLLFVRAGAFFTSGDPELEPKWLALSDRLERVYGYDRLRFILRVRLPFLEIPTISSSWLNLITLSALVECTGSERYRSLLGELAEDYREQVNPYFIGLELLHGPASDAARRASLLRIARERLETYSLTNTSREWDNLGRGTYRLALPPRWIKNSWALQSTTPVPFYDQAGDRYLWKRDLRRLRGNPAGPGTLVYSGVDFFEAYWLLAYAEKHGGAREAEAAPFSRDSITFRRRSRH